MKDKDTPLSLVRLWAKLAPDCYEQLDMCRVAKLDGAMSWPDYCVLPINAAQTYLVYSLGLSNEDAAAGCAELTACWTWRQNKVLYAFDADLASLLAAQADDVKDSDVLPADLLMHLPYPCIYIKAPGILEYTDGFWAWVDFDVNRGAPELRIQWVMEDMSHSFPQVLHIIPGGTIADCFLDTIQTTMEHTSGPVDITHPADSSRTILSAIQLLLYLISDNAEVEDVPPPVRVVRDHSSPKVRKLIQDKASEVQTKNVGIRIGNTIRRTISHSGGGGNSGSGSSKRPHMRRGHWHNYWTGPLDGDRRLILKWTAPTMIHPEEGVDDNVVIYPIKDSGEI